MGVSPDQQQTVSMITTVVTLSAGVAARLVRSNGNRKYLLVQVTGAAVATIKEDSAPVAGGGISLDPPATANGQGGVWNPTEVVPTNELWGISTTGTTVIVVEA